MNRSHKQEVDEYVESILSGRKIACKYLQKAVVRYTANCANSDYYQDFTAADFVINIIERTFCHKQGQALDGTPMSGKPFLLQQYHKFIVYNLLTFYKAGTKERLIKEAFIFIPRKNTKTTFSAALAFALGLLERLSGSKVYIVAAAMKQALESFDFINWNVRNMGEGDNFRIRDNNQEHSMYREFKNGSMFIQALASSVDRQDSLNCNIAIADEIHAFKTPKQYNIIKEAMKAYTNKLMIGITTAGDSMTSFCYQRLQYCKKILDGLVKDEQYFVFICEADADENGNIDYTNPIIHEMANPGYGVTIRPSEILNDSLQAQNDPQVRKDFFAKSLNVFTAATKAYFNIDEFRRSDRQYRWTIDELRDLPVQWFGGTDLSKLHDLTAAALVGLHDDVLIIVPHCWFPITAAADKAEKDNIPLFGWQQDGWLDMSNAPTVNHAEPVNWYMKMKAAGFNIKEVGHDRKFCREYFVLMKEKGFKIIDQPQYYYKKSEGFRYIEEKAKSGKLYYCHAEPFEYCVQNVSAIEKTDDMVQYEKIQPEQRIDVFDAAVFATVRMLESLEEKSVLSSWFE